MQVHPMHVPDASEVAQTRLQIAQQYTQLRHIEAEIARLNVERLHVQNSIRIHESFLAPVRRLPFEILGEIFSIYIHGFGGDDEGDPWVLAHVSRTWRRTAFATPSVWSGIHLNLYPNPNSIVAPRRVQGKECCNTVNQLDLALSRSSNHVLDITIASPPVFPTVVRAHIPAMLHMIAQRMDRWRSLCVDGSISHLPGLDSHPFDNLESLSLQTRDTALLPLINSTAVGLQALRTSQMGLECFVGAVWWPTLISLDLTVPILDPTMVHTHNQTEVLKQVLSTAASLEELTLDFYQMLPNANSEPLAILPSLRKLTLYDVPQLLPFSCPQLTHLQISMAKSRRGVTATTPLPTPSKPIILPYLTHLTFQHSNLMVLSMLVAPSLHELVISPQVRVITPQYNDAALNAIWNVNRTNSEEGVTRGMLSPKIFQLEDLHVSASALTNVLSFMPELQILRIQWVRTDNIALLTSLSSVTNSSSKDSQALVCSKLSQLSIHDASSLRTFDRASMERLLKEVVVNRKSIGCPLKSLICRWPDGGKNAEEFCL